MALFKSIEPIIKGRKVVLVVDNLHKLRSTKEFRSDKSLVDSVCANLKILSGIYKCPVIATVEHTKASIQLGETGGSAIKESSSLHYDANLILTVVVKQVVGTFKLLDMVVSKNKMSTFIGNLPFRLYPDLSKVEECTSTEANFGTPESLKKESSNGQAPSISDGNSPDKGSQDTGMGKTDTK